MVCSCFSWNLWIMAIVRLTEREEHFCKISYESLSLINFYWSQYNWTVTNCKHFRRVYLVGRRFYFHTDCASRGDKKMKEGKPLFVHPRRGHRHLDGQGFYLVTGTYHTKPCRNVANHAVWQNRTASKLTWFLSNFRAGLLANNYTSANF